MFFDEMNNIGLDAKISKDFFQKVPQVAIRANFCKDSGLESKDIHKNVIKSFNQNIKSD